MRTENKDIIKILEYVLELVEKGELSIQDKQDIKDRIRELKYKG